jgi:hypothetical protein
MELARLTDDPGVRIGSPGWIELSLFSLPLGNVDERSGFDSRIAGSAGVTR